LAIASLVVVGPPVLFWTWAQIFRTVDGQSATAPFGNRSRDKPVSEGKRIDKIQAHPWWRAKITEAQVSAIADQLTALNADSVLFVSDHGDMEPWQQGDNGTRTMSNELWAVRSRKFQGARHLKIPLSSDYYHKRLEKAQALIILKQGLDDAEFKGS
jgi:hypothetical protein